MASAASQPPDSDAGRFPGRSLPSAIHRSFVEQIGWVSILHEFQCRHRMAVFDVGCLLAALDQWVAFRDRFCSVRIVCNASEHPVR
jgi:hypothetical protein